MFPTPEHVAAAQEAADYWKAQTGVYVWPSVTLAQAQIESASWTRLSGVNNGFGIKATPAQIEAGQARYVWTTEYVSGSPVKVKQWFANFASLKDAYIAHGRLLATSNYYAKARKARTPQEFISLIGPVYATAPDYAKVILGVMDHGGLYVYDKQGRAPVAPVPKKSDTVIVASASAAAGSIVVAASPYVPHIGFGAIAAFLIVAAGLALAIFAATRKADPVITAANTAAPPIISPSPVTSPPVAIPDDPAPAVAQ